LDFVKTCFVNTDVISYFCNLRFMAYPYFRRSERLTGPASRKFYDHGMFIPDPKMRCLPGLRAKLSQAVSHLFFLQPHALIISQIENRPLSDYYSHQAYQNARFLYFGGSNPGRDLMECKQAISHPYQTSNF
jgi:hypothetical protein